MLIIRVIAVFRHNHEIKYDLFVFPRDDLKVVSRNKSSTSPVEKVEMGWFLGIFGGKFRMNENLKICLDNGFFLLIIRLIIILLLGS